MAETDITTSGGERAVSSGAELPSVRWENFRDILMLVLVVVLAGTAVGALLGVPDIVAAGAALLLGVLAFAAVYGRMAARPDHVRAQQSDRMLKIANESLAYLRRGLDEETAGEVCRIVLNESEAAAVAITDRTTVLGFAGLGSDHHRPGSPIITRATNEALEHNELRVLRTKPEIGCPERDCLLRAAIVVPLEVRDLPAGTLKFYYVSDRFLNETLVAMAEGLARLLSTQLELAELERQTELATQMELKALQAQINPHFLFNTINTIAAFIRTDPAEARRLLRRFGALYRRTLEQADELVAFERELEFVESYLELERARFGDKLQFTVDVDAASRRVTVPSFVLQPIVENSVQHGMRPDGSPLHIKISAHASDAELCVVVEDDGIGIAADDLPHVLEPGFGKGLGIALPNVHERLRGFYGPESGVRISSERGVGTRVDLVIRLAR